jgi:hypothetical protein
VNTLNTLASDFMWTTYNVQLTAGKSSLFSSTESSSDGSVDFTLGVVGNSQTGNLTGTLGLDFGSQPPPPVGAVPEPSTLAFMGLKLDPIESFNPASATGAFQEAISRFQPWRHRRFPAKPEAYMS